MNRIISLSLIIGLIAVSCTDPNTIGLEVQPTSSKINIGLQVGAPYMSWTAENGNVGKGDKQEPRTEETDYTAGLRLGVNIGFKDSVNLLLFTENYNTRFANEKASIDVYGACLDLRY